MATMSYLTDVIGPRLTGSPNMKRANEWTRDKLAAWGLANAHLEAWGPFGRGWSLKRFSAQVVSPQCIPLIGFPKAWSPGVEGTLEAPVVYFDAKTEADFDKFKGKLKGAIVLVSPIREVQARWEPLAGARPIPSCWCWLMRRTEHPRFRPPRGGTGAGPGCSRRARSGGRACSRGGSSQSASGWRARTATAERSVQVARDVSPDGTPAEEAPVPRERRHRHARRAKQPG